MLVQGGPDVHFRNVQLNSSGVAHDCFVAGQFWNQSAAIYCVELGVQGGWNVPANV